MCDVIRHRGPDDEGVWVDEGVALGMRRLSIIDLSTGHQPIHNEDRTVWIVFNGEIYNFQRAAARARGGRTPFLHVDRHRGDRPRLRAVGRGARSRRLRGMFGLAIWDARSRTLLVARDRIGIKPLHYAERRTAGFYFGSEIKSLLEAPDLPRDLDLDALDHYLSFLYTPRDGSIFTSVRKLPPGHLLTWTRRPDRRSSSTGSCRPTETFTRIRGGRGRSSCARVLTDAVRSHLVSDVPLGAFLSGGVDSSLVVGLMAETSERAREDVLDRLRRAGVRRARARAARRRPLRHRSPRVRRQARRRRHPRPSSSSHFDEPFADSSAIPTWYVSEMARRHVTVVLSGDGGDELFGGYDRYLPHPRVVAFDRYSPRRASARRGDRGGAAAARRARQELPAPRRPRRSGTLSRRDSLLRRRREAGAAHRRTCAGASAGPIPRRGSRAISSASRSCRGRAR